MCFISVVKPHLSPMSLCSVVLVTCTCHVYYKSNRRLQFLKISLKTLKELGCHVFTSIINYRRTKLMAKCVSAKTFLEPSVRVWISTVIDFYFFSFVFFYLFFFLCTNNFISCTIINIYMFYYRMQRNLFY